MEREQLLELLKHMSLYPDRYLESGLEELTGFSGALASLLDDLEDDQVIRKDIDNGNFYGLDRIVAERLRQVASKELGGEGYSPEHDMQYVNGELAVAAMRYTAAALPLEVVGRSLACPLHPEASPLMDAWPWGEARWKPSADPMENLAKAAALIAAEMDRLNAEHSGSPVVSVQNTEAAAAAIALAPTQAETRIKDLEEKAQKWDEAKSVSVALDVKLAESLGKNIGFASKDFEVACFLLGALIDSAFNDQVPENGLVCSAQLSDGSEILIEARRRDGEPYVKVAEQWREKAELLDWLGEVYPRLSIFGKIIVGRQLICSGDGIWSCGNNHLGGHFRGKTAIDAIRAAKEAGG